jgi:hypothetical protein
MSCLLIRMAIIYWAHTYSSLLLTETEPTIETLHFVHWNLLAVCILLVTCLLFDLGQKGSTFLQNNGELLPDYMVSHPRRQQYSSLYFAVSISKMHSIQRKFSHNHLSDFKQNIAPRSTWGIFRLHKQILNFVTETGLWTYKFQLQKFTNYREGKYCHCPAQNFAHGNRTWTSEIQNVFQNDWTLNLVHKKNAYTEELKLYWDWDLQ